MNNRSGSSSGREAWYAPNPEEQATQRTDRQLVERTLEGDTDAFAILHRRYYGRVYRLALVRCRSAQDAEDVASETFVRAIAHLAGYRFQGDSLFPWLSRIAANLIADMGRRQRGATFVSLDGADINEGVRSLIEGLKSDSPDPQALAERQEVQALVRAAIRGLPPDQADAILLRFVGDLPLKEIAAAMNRTEGAIKSLLHRALIGLRRSLTTGEKSAEVFGQASGTKNTVGTVSRDAETGVRETRLQNRNMDPGTRTGDGTGAAD